jgi:hypothetical protein
MKAQGIRARYFTEEDHVNVLNKGRATVRTVLVLMLFLAARATGGTIAPGWEPNYGSLIAGAAQKDDGISLVDLGFGFPFFDKSYTSLYVSSNGFVQFGGNSIGTAFVPDVLSLFSGDATIAGAWVDIYPPGSPEGGGVYLNAAAPGRAVVTWYAVPECCDAVPDANSGRLSTFQIQLFSSGQIILAYDQFSVPGTVGWHEALIGVSPGGGALVSGQMSLMDAAYPMYLEGPVFQFLNTDSAVDLSGKSFSFATGDPAAQVPEPSTAALLAVGAVGLIISHHRRGSGLSGSLDWAGNARRQVGTHCSAPVSMEAPSRIKVIPQS